MMIAAGFRKIRKNASGDKYVIFDQGTYNIPENAQVESKDGEDWIWCEAHVDPDTDRGYAELGARRVELAAPGEGSGDPNSSSDDGEDDDREIPDDSEIKAEFKEFLQDDDLEGAIDFVSQSVEDYVMAVSTVKSMINDIVSYVRGE